MIKLTAVMLSAAVFMLLPAGHCADDGLVAWYTFDEGKGSVAHDASGNGNHGTIHGARFLETGAGYCLEFDGNGSYVDCGNDPSLDLRESVSTEAWVLPVGRPNGEPGILGKQFEAYLLTYYSDGQAWSYIGSGSNNVHTSVPVGEWHHIATTFDGKTSRIYLDGKLANSRDSMFDHIPSAGKFLIGCVSGREDATDPNYTRTAFFMGLIDEVRVYSRALSAEEVSVRASAGARPEPPREPMRRFSAAKSIGQGDVRVRFGAQGEARISAGRQTYVLESQFSYPGDEIGWNGIPAEKEIPQSGWAPTVEKLSPTAARIRGRGEQYDLARSVRVEDGLVVVQDTLSNRGAEAVGLVIRHSLTSPARFDEIVAPGGAENPTVFLSGRRGALGILMEDDLSRLRYQPIVGLRSNQIGLRLGNIVLDSGKSITLRYVLWPLGGGSDYFDFINAVRRRWDTNFTMQGPFDWISLTNPLLDQPEKLKAYLQRKRVKLMALSPWLDYDPGTEDRVWTRDEFKQYAIKAIRALKAADPEILCIGCIETDWVTIYPEKIPGGDKLPVYGTGSGLLNTEQTRIIDEANLPWKDSVKRDAQGRLTLELYGRGGKPQTALSVYPAVGNYQYEFLLNQVKFLFDEVGADGYYIDEFSQGWSGGIPSYEGWDGVSADIDGRTGRIVRKYVDCSLAGRQARIKLAEYGLDRGKVVIANTFSTSMGEQALGVNRFSETWGTFDPMMTPDGEKPAGLAALYRSNLGSTIGLGILGHPEKHDTARRLMKAVITYLRHGMVYYHYFLEDIPESGEGSGEYGPVNHMFPITPVELREGALVGRERTLACVSGDYIWAGEAAPVVRVFDLNGLPVPVDAPAEPQGDGWLVKLRLSDWQQIAVISAQ